MQTPDSHHELLAALASHLAYETHPPDDLLAALRILARRGERTPSRLELLERLAAAAGPELDTFRTSFRRRLLADARALYTARCEASPDAAPPADEELHALAAGLPCGRRDDEERFARAERVLQLLRDQALLRAIGAEKLPEATALLEAELAEARAHLATDPIFLHELTPIPERVPMLFRSQLTARERQQRAAAAGLLAGTPTTFDRALELYVLEEIEARLLSPSTPEQRAHWMNLALQAEGPRAATTLLQLARTPAEQERLAILVALRFGAAAGETTEDCRQWLEETRALAESLEQTRNRLRRDYAAEVAQEWYRGAQGSEPEQALVLDRLVIENAAGLSSDDFLARWNGRLPEEEREVLRGHVPIPPKVSVFSPAQPPPLPGAYRPATPLPNPVPPPIAPRAVFRPSLAKYLATTESGRGEGRTASEAAAPASAPLAPPPAPPAPPVPREPSVWEAHVQPFLAANWYIFAGTAMVVLGASLLAYFTWDKHWLVRYTLLPALLALLTESFASVGGWLEKQSVRLRGTAVMLRMGAVALLPLNFLAVGLLGRDPEVTHRGLYALLMLAGYVVLFGWRVQRWCSGVSPGLSRGFPATLVGLSSLVALLPAAVAATERSQGPLLLTAGLYAGFAGLAWTAWRLLRRELDPKMVSERVVPWFAGGALSMTFLQVFAWSHWLSGLVPHPASYAVLAVLAGGLVLFMERRFLQARGEEGAYGSESFLGFALILLGILLGMGDPHVRLVTLLLAGIVWLMQAERRTGPLHHWIGLCLIALAAAAAGLLPGFPRSTQLNALPVLGLATAAGFGVLRYGARALGRARLSQAAAEFQPAVVLLTGVVTVLSQWHFRSAPMGAGVVLALCAALLLWRAHRMQRLALAHAAMAFAALALPYLGCVDMMGRTLHGNTLVFGLAVLSAFWLALIGYWKEPVLLQARSTVLWIYGALALAAMIFRVTLEQGTPGDLSWVRAVLDYAGPFLMTAILILASWYSRSLIPSFIAIALVLVLFPELRARFQAVIPESTWGSGLGSAVGALALALVAFPVRRMKKLQKLEEGDRFLGTISFPLQRRDASLFLIPLVAAAVFLAAKINFWTVWQRLLAGTLEYKTVAALTLTGLTWTALAVLLRQRPSARGLVPLSWIAFYQALHFGFPGYAAQPVRELPILAFLLLVLGTWAVARALELRWPWLKELFSRPALVVLDAMSQLIAVAGAAWLIAGGSLARYDLLLAFAAAQLVWHALRRRQMHYGIELFVLAVAGILAVWTPGSGPLVLRFHPLSVFVPLLTFALVIQAVHLALEWSPRNLERLRPLTRPFQGGSVVLLFALTALAASRLLMFSGPSFPLLWSGLLLAGLLLAARANASTPLLLLPIAYTYLLLHHPLFGTRTLSRCVDLLLEPWHLGALAVVLVAILEVGRYLAVRAPRLLRGADPLGEDAMPSLWLRIPAALVATAALARHALSPTWRNDPQQLWGSYFAAAALIWLTLADFTAPLLGVAAGALTLANLHLARHFAGPQLEAWGVPDAHVLCIALLLTLVQGTVLRLLTRRGEMYRALTWTSLVLASAILLLLSLGYFAHPNLAAMQTPRFAVSGLLALGAGYYFRRTARRESEPPGVRAFSESLYHFGVTVAVWCFALMIPPLRSPYTALAALALPVLYFYVRAELGLSHSSAEASEREEEVRRRYRTSCATLGLLLLAMYGLRPLFQMVLFPGQPFQLDYYHWNSPLALVLAAVLIRLYGLGGSPWLAFYGGLSLMMGVFFAVTAFPGLSPFTAPVAAAWTATVLAHFLITAAWHHSPLRIMLQILGRITDEVWAWLGVAWLRCLVVASQVVILSGLLESFTRHADPRHFAPLVLASASVFLHHAVRRHRAWSSVLGKLLILFALHADFLLPSLLPRDAVIWVLLGAGAALLLAHGWLRDIRGLTLGGPGYAALYSLCALHIAYHRPDSAVGLAATALLGILIALTPRPEPLPASAEERLFAYALPLFIPWLVFFGGKSSGYQPDALVYPLLAATASVLGLAFLIRFSGSSIREWITRLTSTQPRLLTQSVILLDGARSAVLLLGATGALLAGGLITALHYDSPLSGGELTLLLLLWSGSAVAFFFEGRDRRHPLPYYLAQLAAVAFFVTVRRHLMLTTGFWTMEYDVWASLAVACLLAGAKEHLGRAAPGMSSSLVGALVALPLVALVWVFVHGLGTDVALVVMGLHSLIFTFLGKGERESPYNLVAVAGFVAFVVTLFWSKLGIHTLHSYVLPIGFGVLALVQLFGREMHPEARNRIRLVTLAAMLGSAGYYALADGRHPIAFNLVMLILCLAAMGLGSLLRIRIYLLAGMAALLVDLASIAYKVVMRLDGTYRMTTLGAGLLLLGGLLVAASVHYKAHEDEWEARLSRLRARLESWS